MGHKAPLIDLLPSFTRMSIMRVLVFWHINTCTRDSKTGFQSGSAEGKKSKEHLFTVDVVAFLKGRVAAACEEDGHLWKQTRMHQRARPRMA